LQELVLRFERGQPYEPAEIQAAFETVLSGILENGAARGGAYVTPEVESGIGSSRVRIPDGLLYRLEPPFGQAELGEPPPWPELPELSRKGLWEDRVREYAARMATMAAVSALRLGDTERARADLDRALGWNPDDPVARSNREALAGTDP
jgi:hypothetical protein